MATLKRDRDRDNFFSASVEGGTLYVLDDTYIDAKFEGAEALFQEQHPSVERGAALDELKSACEDEWDACLKEAEADVLDSAHWEALAPTLEPGQDLDGLTFWIEE